MLSHNRCQCLHRQLDKISIHNKISIKDHHMHLQVPQQTIQHRMPDIISKTIIQHKIINTGHQVHRQLVDIILGTIPATDSIQVNPDNNKQS